MKNNIRKSMIILISILISVLCFPVKIQAASFSLSKSKSSVTVGESFQVTISGVYGIVSIKGNNVNLSVSGEKFIESGSLTLTATTKSTGTASVTVKAIDAATTGKDPQEVTGSKTVSVTVNPKEEPKPEPTPPQTTKPKPTTPKPTTPKKPIVETKEKEEASSQWGIHSLKLIGVKENGEEVELALDKEFNITIYKYTCNAASDIKTVKISKEAYEYNELVNISGLEEELKVGENQIYLKMSKEGKEELNYSIKIIKEEPKKEEESKEVNALVEQTKEKTKVMVQIPLGWFIILEIAIVAISVAITVAVMLYLKKHKNKTEEEFKAIR